MSNIDLNTKPYFDDYAESKKFYKILFRPGRAVQARELTQLQTLIQNQISRFGKHFFKDIALVNPRPSLGCKYDPTTVFVKIPANSTSRTQTEANLKQYWMNKKIRSQSLVEGTVIGYHLSDTWVKLFISLEKAGTTTNNFQKGDTLSVDVVNTLVDGTLSITTTLTATVYETPNAVGRIVSVEIPDSIYFYNGYFVVVDRQRIFIKPDQLENDLAWNASPTCEVGIQMTESIVTFQEDESLLDNAAGTSNFSAPGADRLKIEGVLTTKALNTTEQNFIKILSVTQGVITKAWQLETDPYNDPYKAILAKRTFDESGNYTVKPFIAETRKFLTTDTQGLFIEDNLSVPIEDPTDSLSESAAREAARKIAKDVFEDGSDVPATFIRNNRVYPGTSYDSPTDPTSFLKLCDDRIGLRFQPGSAYVEGYFQEKAVLTNVSIKKSRTSDFIQNRVIQTPKGTSLLVTNLVGFPPINDPGTSNLSYDQVELHSKVLTTRGSQPAATTKIGTARVYSVSLYSGANGSYNATYSLGIFDVKFVGNNDASDVASIYYPGGSTSGSFSANMVFRDVTTNPSLRFTGTINRYLSREITSTTTNRSISHITDVATGTTDVTIKYLTSDSNAEDVRDVDFSENFTVGTFLSLTTTSAVERQITAVSKSQTAGSTPNTVESYDIVIRINQSISNSATLTAVKTIRKIKGVGTLWKSNAGEKLEQGDQVAIGTGDKRTLYTVYANPSNDNELSLEPDPTASTPAWENGSVMTYLLAEAIQDDSLGNAGLVYRLPHPDIRSLSGGTKNNVDYNSLPATYVASRYVVAGQGTNSTQTNISSTGITYTCSPTEDFERGLSNYALVDLNTGNWFELFTSGNNIGSVENTNSENNVYRAVVSYDQVNQVKFNVNIANTSTARFGILIPLEKRLTSAKAGKKTLIKGRFVNGSYAPTKAKQVVVTSQENVKDNKKISLGVPDVFRITRIVESPGVQTEPSNKEILPTGHNDITHKYMLDNGQRDYYYGIAEVELRPGEDAPKGRIRIEFDYFEHSVEGDYFCVDSYPWNAEVSDNNTPQMTYEEIPQYLSSQYGTYELKSCLDFRPVCLEGTNATQNGKLSFVRYKDLPIQDVIVSYHVFEERRDKIYIDKNGLIKIKYGAPAILAEPPAEPTDGMVLYDVQMLPYTEDYRKCILKMRDNRRYTMRDISRLENRIKTLEYYTSLSLLEKDTRDLVIKDALGQDKFKHGFMVDTFSNESVADHGHPDMTAALDKISAELKPRIFVNNINVVEKWSVPSILSDSNYNSVRHARESNNYERSGSLFTLSYSSVPYLEQQLASRLINVNPYNVRAYVGVLKITPWTDTWRDTIVSEPLIVYDTSAYDFARQQFNQNGERTDWHGEKTDWSAIEVSQEKTGENVIRAGHSWPATDGKYVDANTGELKSKSELKDGQWVIVPDGNKNAGERVRYSKREAQIQEVITNTITQTGEKYMTGIRSQIVDAGFTAPISMGSRIINSRSADHIRSNEIKFDGKCFLPGSKLYAYFDGVDVTKYCFPDVNFGDRLESPSSMRRGPYNSLQIQVQKNEIKITGDRSHAVGSEQHSISDILVSDTNSQREHVLARYDYATIVSYAANADEDALDLDGTGTKLTGKVRVLHNNSTNPAENGLVPANTYYLKGDDDTKFLTELYVNQDDTRNNTVVLVQSLLGEYCIKQIVNNKIALLYTPFIAQGSSQYVHPSTEQGWFGCLNLTQVIQKLYTGRYVDMSYIEAAENITVDRFDYERTTGESEKEKKYNLLNKQIKSVRYTPVNETTGGTDLVFVLDDKVDFGKEEELITVTNVKIKNVSTDKTLQAPSALPELRCDARGRIKGKFVIPNPAVEGNPKFRTGERIFRLTNSQKNEEIPEVSRADAKYSAMGWIDVKQDQLYSTKQFRIDQQYVEGKRTPVTLTDTFETLGKVCPRDPLAQSFIVSEPTGIYLTAVDVFFYSKDPNLPIILQIRPLDEGGNPSIRLMYEMVLDSENVVVNEIDLANQTLTVRGNPNGIVGFNKGPWNATTNPNEDVMRVLSANQLSGKNTAEIPDGTAFRYTTIAGESSPYNDMIPTRFIFEYPIYLPGNNTNYCFVLLTDSIQPPGTGIEALKQTYQCYMAQTGTAPITSPNNPPTATPVHLIKPLETGEDDDNYVLGTDQQLSSTNSLGVLFKSINGISWESDQRADLKFNLHRARFNTGINAEIEFINEKLGATQLIFDPFETVVGSSKIRVYHRNHNIPTGSRVAFFGLPSNGTGLNGIPYAILGRISGHVIETPTLDSYVINLAADGVTATETGRIGGKTVYATGQLRFEEFYLRANAIVLPETNITWRYAGITGQAAYDPEAVPWLPIQEFNFSENSDVALPRPALIASALNEAIQEEMNDTTLPTGRNTSVKIVATLSSRSEFISPVLDQDRLSMDVKGIRLDDPVGTGVENNNINNTLFDTVEVLPTNSAPVVDSATLNGKIYFSDTDNKLTGSSFIFEGKKIIGVGSLFSSELKIGDEVKHPMLDDTRRVVEIVSDTELYIDEAFPLSDITPAPQDGGGSETLLYNPPFLRLKTSDANVAVHLSTLDVGKYLTVSNTVDSARDFVNKKILAVNYTPNSTLSDPNLNNQPCRCEIVVEHRLKETASPGFEIWDTSATNSLQISQLNNFIDEIAPMGGSVASKYVTKTMRLNKSANTLRVMFDGCRPRHANIDLYYKVGGASDADTFESKNWTKLEYTVENNGVLESAVPETNSNLLSFSAYEANALQLPPFTMAKVKIVLRGGHTTLYPKVKNLRLIALEE